MKNMLTRSRAIYAENRGESLPDSQACKMMNEKDIRKLLREESFFYSNQEIQSFLEDKNIARFVSAIMQRIYLLRNQLIHGGATHQGRMNTVQVEDCKTLVMKLLPCMISIMMKYPKKNWGELCYPPLY